MASRRRLEGWSGGEGRGRCGGQARRCWSGVDAGTTNTKAVVFDATGRVVASVTEPTPIRYPRPEWAEYDGEGLWRTAATAIRSALEGVSDPARVQGVCFASMGETAVPIDRAGDATGPAIAWLNPVGTRLDIGNTN